MNSRDSCEHYLFNENGDSQAINSLSESKKFTSTYNLFDKILSVHSIYKSIPTLTSPCNCKPCICEECTIFTQSFDINHIELRNLHDNILSEELQVDVECNNNISKISSHNYSDDRFISMTCEPCQTTESSQTSTGENQENIVPFEDLAQKESGHCCGYCPEHCLSAPYNLFSEIRDPEKVLAKCLIDPCNRSYAFSSDIFGEPTDEVIFENKPVLNQGKIVHVYNPICEPDALFHFSQYQKKLLTTRPLKQQELKCTNATECKCTICECLSCAFQEKASLIESQDSRIIECIKDEWKRRLRFDRHETQDCVIKYGSILEENPTKKTNTNVGKMCCSENCSRFRKICSGTKAPCQSSSNNQNGTFLKRGPFREMLDVVYIPEIDIKERNQKLQNKRISQGSNWFPVGNEMETNTVYITADKSNQTVNSQQVKKYEFTLKIEIVTPNIDKNMLTTVSKNKILEQTQNVIKDIVKDISMSYPAEQPEELSVKDQTKPMKTTLVKQTPSFSSSSSTRNQGNKNDSNSSAELEPKPTTFTESELAKCMEEFRVQEPIAKKVSHNTVRLTWKLPKVVKEIRGYEILVDGKSVDKILNPKRCIAVVTCLPHVCNVLITIRSITKAPHRGLLPCTTIAYRPRSNKYIRI